MLVSCVKPCRPIFEIEFVPTFAAQSLSHFSFLPILIENISLRRQGHRLTQNICRCYQNYSRPLLRYCLTLVCFTGNLQFVSRLRGMFNFAKLHRTCLNNKKKSDYLLPSNRMTMHSQSLFSQTTVLFKDIPQS